MTETFRESDLTLRLQKKTRIVATVGPASSSREVLRGLMLAGLDVVRINFSHAKHEQLTETLTIIRELCAQTGINVAIMGDLRGPRIRIGDLENGQVTLTDGQRVVLTPEPIVGDAARISTSFPKLAGDVEIGAILLVDDGNLVFMVEQISENGEVVCRVERGGVLSNRRGINLPGRKVSIDSLTERDFEDIEFAIAQKFDFLAQSFVQTAADVRQLNEYLGSKGAPIPVIAKIEKKSALDDIEAISKEAFGVMVARGDLALEMSLQDVPIAQKRIISVCRRNATPVITATQMLESMTTNPKPTRAEATDVANAILDGTDAVMLSGESAIGKNPVEVVKMMARIAIRAESAWTQGELPTPSDFGGNEELESAVGHAAQHLAELLRAKAILVYTTTGQTARLISCHRPLIPILALCPTPEAARRCSMMWGVRTALVEQVTGTAHMVRLSQENAHRFMGAREGDILTIVAGTPFGTPGKTNLIKVEIMPGENAAPSFSMD